MDYPRVIALLNELDKTFNQIQRIHTLQSDSYKKFVVDCTLDRAK